MMQTKSLRIAVAATLVLALSALVLGVGGAEAARGGKRGGSGSGGSGTCAVAPNPVAKNAAFTISGSGYPAYIGLTLKIATAGATTFQFSSTSSTGTFSSLGSVAYAGTNTVSVYNMATSALLSTCSFSSY